MFGDGGRLRGGVVWVSVVLLCSVLLPSSAAHADSRSVVIDGVALTATEAEFVGRINGLRHSLGLSVLRVDPRLTESSRAWSRQMELNGEMAHDPLAIAGNVRSSAWVGSVSENVGRFVERSDTVRVLHDAFVASPGHYANLVGEGVTLIGVGDVVGSDGDFFTTHRFARASQPLANPDPDLSLPCSGLLAAGISEAVTDARSGALARLYCGVFGRVPDRSGFDYWKSLMLSGQVDLRSASYYFQQSSEYEARFGNPSNAEFVARLYRNVLGRQGEAAGQRYWVIQLDAGVAREDMIVFFTDSAENVHRTGTS